MGSSAKEHSQDRDSTRVGGQAVIEGVMMRSPWRVATAVRDPQGEIQVTSRPYVSRTKSHPLWKLPVFRGAVGLFEAMSIGVGALNWSAQIAEPEEDRSGPTFWERLVEVLVMLGAFALAIGLFMAVPYFVAGLVPRTENQFLFHLIAGFLRIVLLIGYMGAISLVPDIRAVFQYHGAEHKSIFAFEKGKALSSGQACSESRFHPRCGTSFLLLAAVLTMIGFALFDSLFVLAGGEFGNLFMRILIHLPLIPVIAGLSYEVLRIIEKHSEDPAWRPLVQPGFLLQRITTREPDDAQVEVALAALKESLVESSETYEGPIRDASMKPAETHSSVA